MLSGRRKVVAAGSYAGFRKDNLYFKINNHINKTR